LSSQLDLLPTLISLMGLEVSSPLIGRNLLNTSAPTQGRFIMQFDQLQAPPGGRSNGAAAARGRAQNAQPEPQKWQISPARPELINKSIAHALYAKWAYAKDWHGQ
jgi:hypothetical protein